MKRYLLLSAATLLLAATGFAQKEKEEKGEKSINPPASIKTAFEKAFPKASKVKWKKEDGDIEAAFTQDGREMSVVYDSKGALKETETDIKVSELPAAVAEYVKRHYKGAKIHEAAKVLKPNGEINYEAEVKDLDLVFDANGKFIKAEKD